MKERLLNIWQSLKEKTAGLSSKTKKMIVAAVAFCVLLSIGLAVWLNNRPYEVLFSGLSSEEASEIIGRLQEEGVEYKYQNDGTILVPQAQEEKLKAQLVYEGYPDSGFTYDLFTENVSLTSTESEKEHYQLLNLQERMGATIKLFPNIKDAKVTIALGKDSRYVLDDTNAKEATVSATITTKNGKQIDEEEVRAIQRLMSKSIPDVKFENIAVICNGQDVSLEEEGESTSLSSKLKLSLEREMENKIRKEISNLLFPIYGEGHFQVSVKCDLDINKKMREMINYSAEDPKKNTGVISSETAGWEINREEQGKAGGVPGTETNSDIPVYTKITSDGKESSIGANGDINYLVDQLKEQTEVRAGDLKDLTVAVIIDGNDLGGLSRNELVSLVAKASGISPENQFEKIEVLNAKFYSDAADEAETGKGFFASMDKGKLIILAVAVGIGLLLLAVLITVLILRKKKKKQKAEEEAQWEESLETAEEEPSPELPQYKNEGDNPHWDEDLLSIQNERGIELKNKIRDFAEENPEISAQLLKHWLRGGEQDG